MTPFSILPAVAGLCSLVLAGASVLRKKPSVATWCLAAGLTALGADSLLAAAAASATQPDEIAAWLGRSFLAKSLAPVAWLGFSLTYSRGGSRTLTPSQRALLAAAGVVPVALAAAFREELVRVVLLDGDVGLWVLQVAQAGRVLNGVLLVAFVFAAMNLEQTYRAAVGTMRWRIKLVVLALAAIFGTHIYARTQALLYPVYNLGLADLEAGALLVGCGLMVAAYVRAGWAEVDVYPSRAVLGSSVTVLLVGGYLLTVGILAQVVQRLGSAEAFQAQALVVLLGMVGLTLLLSSDRVRQRVRAVATRHFGKAQHDSVRLWTLFSRQLGSVQDVATACRACVRLISDAFDVLSVTIWVVDDQSRLQIGASSAQASGPEVLNTSSHADAATVVSGLHTRAAPFDLEAVTEPWAAEWRQLNAAAFSGGGHRWCVPLVTGGDVLGAIVLGDRVGGASYTAEEVDLLRCIGDQVASSLTNLRLSQQVAAAKELDAFRTMSAFFVHDLKNAASSLNLTLKNLPVHFDDPDFRTDALKAIGNTARRIDDMLARLGALRQHRDVAPTETDLNQVVRDVLERVPGNTVASRLEPLPPILADREQLASVVTNLVMNARDAVSADGHIEVRTERRGGRVVLSVSDDGCGIGPDFVRDSLFRPFQSTKKGGLGIGLFQSRAVVQAHGGSLQVESQPGKGTTFHVSLPVKTAR